MHFAKRHCPFKKKLRPLQLSLLLALSWPLSQADETEGFLQRFDTREYSLVFDERSFAPKNPTLASEPLQSMAVALMRGADAEAIRRIWTHSHPERLRFWDTIQALDLQQSPVMLTLPASVTMTEPAELQAHTWPSAVAIASNQPIGTIRSNAQGLVMFVQGHDRNSKIHQLGQIAGINSLNHHWLIGYGSQGLTINLTQAGVTNALGTDHADFLIGGGRSTVLIHAGRGNDIVIGGAANDVLYGGEGDDLIDGGAGNDRIEGGAGNDRLLGGAGDDVLIGGAGDDELSGGAGNDVLIGGEGNDRILGGDGVDLAIYSRVIAQYRFTHMSKDHWQVAHLPYDDKEYEGADVLIGVEKLSFRDLTHMSITADSAPVPVGEDIDLQRLEQIPHAGPQGQTAWRLPARMLIANDISPSGIPLRLNELVSTQRTPYPRSTWLKSDLGDIKHEANGDILISPLLPHAGRTNTMLIRYTIRDDAGRRGLMVIDRATQVNREAIGIARILVRHSAASAPVRNCFADCVLSHEQSVAQLVGDKAWRIYGGAHADEIRGNALDNVLDGGAGADIMIGRKGDDQYFVDDENDQVIEEPNEGTDTVFSRAPSYTLPANVENLSLLPGAKTGIGNAMDNRITANASGSTLLGMAGNDALFGDDGDDVLDGGMGNDYMSGGQGNDVYIWAPGEGDDLMLAGSNTRFPIRGAAALPQQESTNTLRLRDGVSKADLVFERSGMRQQDLTIRSKTTPGSLTVLSWFDDPIRRIAHIESHQRDVWFTRLEIELLAAQ
jgi:Ca2+-binding RTX toxin-like protein